MESDDAQAQEAQEPLSITLRLRPQGWDDAPILYANHFTVQHENDQFFLTVGQYLIPPLFGTREERLAAAQALDEIPVRVLARYTLPRDDVVTLIAVLQENLRRSEASRPPAPSENGESNVG